MNVNVNVNQRPDTPNQSAMLSCWKFRRLSQRDRLYTTGIKSIPLYLHLFPRKKEERKEIPNVCRHDHPVLYLIQYSWGFQFCSELSWVHQTDDRSIIPSVWNLQFPTDRTDTDVNIPSCLPGIDPILISGWPSSLWLSCHSVLWCCRQFNLPSQECECSEFSLPAIDKSISILIKLGIWVGPLC